MTDVPKQVAQPSPDPLLTTVSGQPFRLSSIWQHQPVLIFFLRHLGCAVCRAELRHLIERAADFEARNIAIVVIAPVDVQAAQTFARMQRLPFLLLADPGRVAYHAFNIGEGSLWDAFGPGVLLRQSAQMLRGNIPSITASGGSVKQLGGVCIVDAAGLLRFRYVANPIYRYPPIEEYLAVLDAIARPSVDTAE